MSVHVHRPATWWLRRVLVCPTCGVRRRVVGMVQVWYDTTWTCCTCGEQWAAGWVLPRPFRPRWRLEQAAKARARWPHATRHVPDAWVESQL